LLLALPLARAEEALPEPVELQLEVKVNGYPLSLIAAFTQSPGGELAAARGELAELGIAAPGDGTPEDLIPLKDVPGLSYVYDESTQSIDLELPNSSRIAKDLTPEQDGEFLEAQSGNGLAVNYTAYAAADYNIPDSATAFDGASLSLDARAFSRFGTLRQSGIIGTTTFSDFTALRLDTTLSFASQKRMETYRLGDVISGGLRWTRPIRLGGAQLQRNFALRPDLVTIPLPNLEGTAAVPSTLDVYIGDVKAYSSEVEPGPFKVDDIPVFTSNGTARIVLTDSTGRSVETESDFYTSPDLLKQGLFDYSLEAGVVRRDFGIESFGYDDEPVGLLSLRYGMTDRITGEVHAEGKSDLLNGGAGALVSGGKLGMFSGAVAGSWHDGDFGFFLHAGWEARFGDLFFNASTSRTFGDYFDLAAATELPPPGKPFTAGVPDALDQFTVGYSFPELKAGVGLSFIHQEKHGEPRSLILSGSYSQSFKNDMSFFVNGYMDFGKAQDYGAFAGFSMPLGKTMSASSSTTVNNESWSAAAEVSRPFGQKEGDYGWRVQHGEGDSRFTTASGAYRTSKGVAEANLGQQNGSITGNAAFTGSAVLAGGGLFMGQQIHDAFAVVDAGVPGVKVDYENRYAGTTGKNGKLLLPNLRSFEKNKIAIDVNDLPLEAAAAESQAIVVPKDGAGVIVDFGVKADAQGVIVQLTDASGTPLTEGAEVALEGSSESFFVGYDGEVYLTGVKPENTVVVKLSESECRVSFTIQATEGEQATIGPLQCI
jgi:outer membrane usher protein